MFGEDAPILIVKYAFNELLNHHLGTVWGYSIFFFKDPTIFEISEQVGLNWDLSPFARQGEENLPLTVSLGTWFNLIKVLT